MLGKLFQLLTTVFVLASAATVAAQAVGVGILWSRGLLEPDKLVRYTGVVYGFDPLDLAPQGTDAPRKVTAESREAILADRVAKTPQLADRAATISLKADDIRGITLTLKRNREKFVAARDGFESLLDQLESETASTALRELQVTLENATPKQAKEILHTMLNSPTSDPTDNVMNDVVRIVKLLPDTKLKKILAEFKTEEERNMLHRILVEIGELDERNAQLSRNQP